MDCVGSKRNAGAGLLIVVFATILGLVVSASDAVAVDHNDFLASAPARHDQGRDSHGACRMIGTSSHGSQLTQSRDEGLDCGRIRGNPVVLSTGNKVEYETDFASAGEMGLHLSRTYNHYWTGVGIFGQHWLSNFDYSLARSGSGGDFLWLQRPDGRRIKFVRVGTTARWNEDKASPIAYIDLTGNVYTHHSEEGTVEQYDVNGYIKHIHNRYGVGWSFMYSGNLLQRVNHTSGRHVLFSWSNGQLLRVTDPDGNKFNYTYAQNALGTGRHRLASATLPGAPETTIQYHYEDSRFPGALTGKSVAGARYSTFQYNADGRVIRMEYAGGVERYTFGYVLEQAPPTTPPPPTPPPGGVCNPATGICTVPLGGRAQPEGVESKLPSVAAAALGSSRVKRVLETNPMGLRTTYEFEGGRMVAVFRDHSPNYQASAQLIEYDDNGNPAIIQDFNQNVTEFTYNAKGQLTELREGVSGGAQKRKTTYVWDPNHHRILRETIHDYLETTYVYGTDMRLGSVSVKNLTGNGSVNQTRTTTYTYTSHPNGMVASVAVDGPLAGTGDRIVSRFNANGDRVSDENGLGHKTTFANHDGFSRPGKVTSPNGAVVDYTYDGRGRTTRRRDQVGGVAADTEYHYNAFGALRMLIQPDGHRLTRVYDAAHRLTSLSEALPQGGYAVRSYEYNSGSLVTVERDDVLNHPIGTNVEGVIDGVYGNTGSGYVVRGWACSKWMDEPIYVHFYAGGPAGSGIGIGSYLANASSEPAVAAACEASGGAYRFNIAITQAILDAHGGKKIYVHAIRPSGGPHPTIAGSGTFSIPGGTSAPPPPLPPDPPECEWPLTCVPRVTPPGTPPMTIMAATEEPRISYTDYDELGRARQRRGADGTTVRQRYRYDNNGNLTQVVDGLGRVTDYLYDALNRLSASIDALEGTTLFQYDAGDRITRVEDPRGLVTTYAYDGFGQLWWQSSPDTGTTAFTYNAAGQRTKMTRSDNSVVSYLYDDPLGRMTGMSAPGLARDFNYDHCTNGKGLLCSVNLRDPNEVLAHTLFHYTSRGQLQARHDTGSGANDITRYVYDPMGRTTRITYPSGMHADYAYHRGKVSSLKAVFPSGSAYDIATGLEYEASGVLSGWTYGNGIARDHSFDADGRRLGISSRHGSTMHQSLTLAYDPNDMITAITDVDPSRSHRFEYDELGRMTKDTIASTTVADYGFDAVGNRTSLVRKDTGVTTSTQVYPIDPGSNRMLSMNGNANRNFFYNSRGHLASSSGWLGNRTYVYDAFDRLQSTTVNGTTTSYLVNALDQRVRKTGPLGTFRYVYAGQNTLLGEHTGAGATGWRNYLYLDGQPVAMVSGNNLRYYLHTDHLGRPEVMTDANRAAVWRAFNGSYSRGVTLGDPTTVVLGFPGQQWDEETSTWYNGFRDYDPYTGRYLQSDPIGLAGGVNTYAYVGANPVNFFDPYGLQRLPADPRDGAWRNDPTYNCSFTIDCMDIFRRIGAISECSNAFPFTRGLGSMACRAVYQTMCEVKTRQYCTGEKVPPQYTPRVIYPGPPNSSEDSTLPAGEVVVGDLIVDREYRPDVNGRGGGGRSFIGGGGGMPIGTVIVGKPEKKKEE